MKHLETFAKWFSKLNTKHKSAIIRKLVEIYEVEVFHELQTEFVLLEIEDKLDILKQIAIPDLSDDEIATLNYLKRNNNF